MEDKRIHILLDLDQTLISSEELEQYDTAKYKEKSKLFKYHNMDNIFLVFERPGLQEFLDFLFANFKVSVWTAASKDYALFVIKNCILAGKTERSLEYILFSYHCKISEKSKGSPKDLSLLWNIEGMEMTPEKTVIIDDLADVFNAQTGNCISIPEFQFTKDGSENDDKLKMIREKLEKLKENEDIRKTVDEINTSIK
jgi:TFIIF-interacting CTD phosphatase-like protein